MATRWFGSWPAPAGSAAGLWFLGLLGVAVALSFPIKALYRRRFGDVRLSGHRGAGPALVASLLMVIMLVWLQERVNWHIPLALLFLGGVLLRLGIVQRGLRLHYVPIACAFVTLALVATFGMSALRRDVALDVLVGVSLIAGGLGDDRVLRRTLQAPPRNEAGYAGAV